MKERLRHTTNHKLTNNMTSNSRMEVLVWNSIIFSLFNGSVVAVFGQSIQIVFDLMRISHIILVRIDQKISIILQTIKSTKIHFRLEKFCFFLIFWPILNSKQKVNFDACMRSLESVKYKYRNKFMIGFFVWIIL